MSYLDKAAALYRLIGEGKWMDAFEQYYAEEIVMLAAGETPRAGKELNRIYERQLLDKLGQLHGAGVDAITSNEDKKITIVESWLDVTKPNGKREKVEQVAVQKWKEDYIIREKIYHK